MRARAGVAWGLAVGAMSAAVVVHAQMPSEPPRAAIRVEVQWRAPPPPACPDEASVRGEVARLLAGSQATVNATATADVSRTGDTWRVLVAMNGGERRLEADSCRALADATALIVAMAVDPARVAANRASRPAASSPPDAGNEADAAASGAASVASATASGVVAGDAGNASDSGAATAAPVASASPSAQPAAAASAPPAPEPPPGAGPASAPSPATSGPQFAVSAALVADFGSLPAPGLGPSLAFAWTPGPFRLELAGAYFFPNDTSPAPSTKAVARFTLFTGALRACWELRAASFEAGPCLEGELASLRGRGGSNVADPLSGSSTWFAPGGGLFGAWRLARNVAVIGRADVLIPTIRDRFQIDATVQHTPATSAARLSLGVELRF